MAVFKTLAFLFVLCCFEIYQTMAAADANPSFLFNGFVKSPSFDENVALFGDSKLVDGGPSIQLTDSVSRSEGRVVYRQPIRLFQGKERNFSGSFSTSFSFSMSNEIGSVLAFVMVPTGLDLRSFDRKGNSNSSSGLGFLLQHKVVAVAFGISKKGNRVGILVGRPESGKIRKLSSLGDQFNGEKKLNCWIDYEASSKRIEVRVSLSTALKPIDPFVSYSVDLAKIWRDGKFVVGLTSANGNCSRSHYLHSWSFKLRHPSMRIHSQPLDPNEVSMTVKEGKKTVEVKGKSRCIWRMLGALVLGAVCGTLGAMLALYLWTICGNRQSMAIVPEECANEKSDIVVMKTDAAEEEGKK
ncbi:PREDICTED: L-type lectin-domain containing receptor kinase IV.2-like [Camelina sativa]|uniref:L-type lectin-domain containing receptor kinase IV.2-like n=1 Tax=Camelina sativa TaxID=90675 RepID=A0ABM0TBY0_CAMSA|nr:PREDICTED: L-type lectin-domain containing receptor kinase IV.2-like [Camelina sativa]